MGNGFDFIVISPCLLSHCGLFFAFGCGVSFFGGFQHSPVNGCSAANCDFGALAGRVACMSFYPTILESELIKARSRMVVARCWVGENVEILFKGTKFQLFRMSKLWKINI